MLTVAVVTLPFKFEGAVRQRQAEQAMKDLHKSVDTVITIYNERLLSTVEETTTFIDSFGLADDVLRQAVQGISDIIAIPGLINVDFADVKTIMGGMGTAVMGIGMAEGKNRAIKATKQSLESPLLEETSIKGAKGLLVNVTGRADLTLFEVNETMSIINNLADPNANIIFGAVLDEKLAEEIKVTVIATGFPNTFIDSSKSSEDQSVNDTKDSRVITFRKRASK
jgi:cell division protein FtsZ